MRIVADSNILAVQSLFDQVGKLTLVPGREIKRSHLLNADVLLVRSITRIDSKLLQGTTVKFVGTATSGIDHVDIDYLQSQGIGFAAAPGSNANAVVDYCFAALAFAVVRRGLQLGGSRVGIVGAGKVGGLFASKLQNLGVKCLINDPPLCESGGNNIPAIEQDSFHSLHEVMQCDVVSVHVPLTSAGSYPTVRLLARQELALLRKDAILINSCRGGVVDEIALLEVLQATPGVTYIGDVWCHEPNASAALVKCAHIATPHIAGYSIDAKLAATRQLLRAVGKWLELKLDESALNESVLNQSVPSDTHATIPDVPQAAWQLILDLFPLEALSEELKTASARGEVAAQFDLMRKRLLSRREFGAYEITTPTSPDQQKLLQTLGFKLP